MNTDKEMKLLKYRMICCLAAALLGIGGLVCFSGSQRPQGDDKALAPSLSANYPIDLSENISLPVLSINEAPLPPDGQDSAADDSYLQDAPSYTDTKDDEVPVMTASDRYTYEEGFFTSPLPTISKHGSTAFPTNRIVPFHTKTFAMYPSCMKILTAKPRPARSSVTRRSPRIWWKFFMNCTAATIRSTK